MRPMPSRPRYGEKSIVEMSIWNGAVASLGAGGTAVEDRVEQRREIDGRDVHVHRRHALARRRVHDGRVELRLVGLELDEEIEHLVVHAHGIGARAGRSC